MDDNDWMMEDPNEVQPEPVPEEVPAEAAAAEGAAAEEAPAEEVKGTDPKKFLCQHWVRPKFLQYTYLYDYRKNYYDDYINYMDKRNRGVATEVPRAQTWGERALRTYVTKAGSNAASLARRQDKSLLRHISVGAKFHRYHIKSTIARKYATLGFNTVSI